MTFFKKYQSNTMSYKKGKVNKISLYLYRFFFILYLQYGFTQKYIDILASIKDASKI
jgi:hypothetical protein